MIGGYPILKVHIAEQLALTASLPRILTQPIRRQGHRESQFIPRRQSRISSLRGAATKLPNNCRSRHCGRCDGPFTNTAHRAVAIPHVHLRPLHLDASHGPAGPRNRRAPAQPSKRDEAELRVLSEIPPSVDSLLRGRSGGDCAGADDGQQRVLAGIVNAQTAEGDAASSFPLSASRRVISTGYLPTAPTPSSETRPCVHASAATEATDRRRMVGSRYNSQSGKEFG
jgi:hypothetical protein